jgi:hypothetical protein
VPNSGNLGSVEVFPVVVHGRGVDPGVYHFDTVGHHLTCLHSGCFDAWLQRRVLLQLDFEGAAAALILTCAVGRLIVGVLEPPHLLRDALWRTETGATVVGGPIGRRVDGVRRRYEEAGITPA